MNADQLLALYDRMAEAPDVIARLRRFILDLAVRGKLVEQDPADEPASELLKRIAVEKARLIRKGKFKTFEGNLERDPSSFPFAIPANWSWCYLDDIAAVARGGSPRPIKSFITEASDGIPWIKIGDSTRGSIYIDETQERIKPEGLAKSRLVIPGDLLLSNSMSFGFPYITNVEGCIHDGWLVIRTPDDLMEKLYLHKVFLSDHAKAAFSMAASGAVVQNLNADKARQLVVPLPPLAEQRQIVAKVDELMVLLDRLEAARTAREATRDRLTAASLTRLTAPDIDAETFHTRARFALGALPALTTRPDQIKSLRQTILNLAVRGKLVEQDPADEPASELLKRIAAEKARLVKAGEIRKEKPLPPLSDEEQEFELPEGWTWCRLGALVLDSDSGWSPRTENHAREGDTWGVLKVSAVSWDHFDPTANKQVLPGTEPRLQAQVQKGDFLISRANTAELIARAVLVSDEPLNLMMSDKIVRLGLAGHCDHRFVWLINNYADFARSYYAAKATGVSPSMKNVSRGVILELPIPLPPLAEQHRIVAKVDTLMALCDRLEASLTATATIRQRLLEALLHEALVPATTREMEAAE